MIGKCFDVRHLLRMFLSRNGTCGGKKFDFWTFVLNGSAANASRLLVAFISFNRDYFTNAFMDSLTR